MTTSASASTTGADVPLLLVRNSGFIGRVEVQVREHCGTTARLASECTAYISVADTHPDNTHTLRIDKPFAKLEEYVRTLDLNSMDSMEHSHVPWVVLLVKAACEWKAKVSQHAQRSLIRQHGGRVPQDLSDESGPDEQKEFKALLNGMRQKPDEENFDEAIAQAYQVWAETTVGRRTV